MPEPIKHPLTPAQQRNVAAMQDAIRQAQQAASLYVQAIADGIDAPDGTKWALEGDALIGTPPGV